MYGGTYMFACTGVCMYHWYIHVCIQCWYSCVHVCRVKPDLAQFKMDKKEIARVEQLQLEYDVRFLIFSFSFNFSIGDFMASP